MHRLLAILIFSALLAGCKSGGPADPVDPGDTDISIDPVSIDVPAYGTVFFTAEVVGLQNTAVVWSIEEGLAGGRVLGDGLYNAPSGGGVFHVRATSVADPELVAVAVVSVSVDWECPTTPPQPAYELVWARETAAWDDHSYHYYDHPGEIVWHGNELWIAHGDHIQHWSDAGTLLGWSGLGWYDPTPSDGYNDGHRTYIGYHEYDPLEFPLGSDDDDGVFNGCRCIAADATGNLYVGDGVAGVQILTPGGIFWHRWDGVHAHSIAVGPDNTVYVEGYGPTTDEVFGLYRFLTNGTLQASLTTVDGEPYEDLLATTPHLAGFDGSGLCYLPLNFAQRQIAVLTPDLVYLGSTVRTGDDPCRSRGGPTVVDPQGNILIANRNTLRFQKFDRNGLPLASWPAVDIVPSGLALDPQGNLYVSGQRVGAPGGNYGRILKYRPAGSLRE